MKLLLLTGRLAQGRVRELAERFGVEAYVFPLEVASFISPEQVTREFEGKDLRGYEALMVPGSAGGDFSSAGEKLGVKVFKGTRDIAAADLLLERMGEVELSPSRPADEVLREEMALRAREEIEEVERPGVKKELLEKEENFPLGTLPVGRDFPMRVVAEVAGAEKLNRKEIMERGSYYLEQGADIIDIGVKDRNPGAVEEAVEALGGLEAPLSIDTMERKNIEVAIDSGIDLVLSFSRELIQELPGTKVPSVVVPMARGKIPPGAEERVETLEENLELAGKLGFSMPIADPVLSHPGFGLVESLTAYRIFRNKNPGYPLLMGTGNVTELLDADSVGVNALLASLASEVGVELLFTTEASDKTTGSVKELSLASRMMFLAQRRSSPPKDLGIDLLELKEKRISREEIPPQISSARVVEAMNKKSHFPRDPRGYFRIFVWDRIYAAHYREGEFQLVITGRSAEEVSRTIEELKLIAEPSHGLYLGRELDKAEIALKYGKSYIQG